MFLEEIVEAQATASHPKDSLSMEERERRLDAFDLWHRVQILRKACEEELEKLAERIPKEANWQMEYAQWVQKLNCLTPECFTETVTVLTIEDGQVRLHTFLETLSLILSQERLHLVERSYPNKRYTYMIHIYI